MRFPAASYWKESVFPWRSEISVILQGPGLNELNVHVPWLAKVRIKSPPPLKLPE